MDSLEHNRQGVSFWMDDQLSANRIGILKMNQDQIFMVNIIFIHVKDFGSWKKQCKI